MYGLKEMKKRRDDIHDGIKLIPFGCGHGIHKDKIHILYTLLRIWDYYMAKMVTMVRTW